MLISRDEEEEEEGDADGWLSHRSTRRTHAPSTPLPISWLLVPCLSTANLLFTALGEGVLYTRFANLTGSIVQLVGLEFG